MKIIPYTTIVNAVRDICMQACYKLPDDIYKALSKAEKTEQLPLGKSILQKCLQNADLAVTDHLPICQDTGMAVFFVTLGDDIRIDGGLLTDAINEGTKLGYAEGYLRKSIVCDPLFDRVNTSDNTPAFIHIDLVKGDKLSITVLPKGGGCENMSALSMMKPADDKDSIIDFVVATIKKAGGNPCPPVVIGIGIGGTADTAAVLAKKALLRQVDSSHSDNRYAALEQEILLRVNCTGVGPQGLGGTTTALAVHIEHAPCHIASMPVAININCHAARNASVEF
jgi:fumarate hydratase subunit alpha